MATYTDTRIGAGITGDSGSTDTTLSRTGEQISAGITGNGDTVDTTLNRVEEPVETGLSIEPGAVLDLSTYAEEQIRSSIDPDGFIIPTGEFRDVTVVIEDSAGDPIPEGLFIQSAGLFPTAARVRQADDGSTYALLFLLNAAYEDMALVAESGGATYVWYEAESSDGVPKETDQVTLQFEKKFKRGLDAGQGIDLGGPLG